MRLSNHFAVYFSAVASLAAIPGYGQAQNDIMPSEVKAYYDANTSLISTNKLVAEDITKPAAERLKAFQTLSVRFPFATLDTAIKLAADSNLDLALEGVNFLSSAVVMMNHGPSMESHDKHAVNDPVARALGALRVSMQDRRPEIRDIASASLTSLNDEQSLKWLTRAYEKGVISDTEAVRYMTLAKPSVASPYIAPFLEKGSVEAQTQVISYLGATEQYRKKILDDYLLNPAAQIELRAVAAKTLAKSDPAFGSYATALIGDPKLPAPVYAALVSDINPNLPPKVISDIFGKAAKSQLKNKDPAKASALNDSVKRYEALRPDVNLEAYQAPLRRLNRI
jgi:hypothetical protein